MGSPSKPASLDGSMVLIEGGVLRPFYPPTDNDKEIQIHRFRIDKRPVTNEDFLNFVKKNIAWQRGNAKKIFVDQYYLSHWKSPTELKDKSEANQPVTFVSWFAAKAYCETQGKRLPTEYEWEYVGQASATVKDASHEKSWRDYLLDVYSRPGVRVLPQVALGEPNAFGVYDMHTLVWEWVKDFNGSLLRVDSREGNDADKMKFCGASALEASERDDYPSFIRMAYRSSLKARYSNGFLGFRCAREES